MILYMVKDDVGLYVVMDDMNIIEEFFERCGVVVWVRLVRK